MERLQVKVIPSEKTNPGYSFLNVTVWFDVWTLFSGKLVETYAQIIRLPHYYYKSIHKNKDKITEFRGTGKF